MLIQTSRFGPLCADESRLVRFPIGIFGFPDTHAYALVQMGDDESFYWLQATHPPDLAFLVCDPRLFLPDYTVPVKAEDLHAIGLDDPAGLQVFIIVNKVGNLLTGNLQGPIVINARTYVARQLVLSERFGTRHLLMVLPPREAPISKTG